MRLKIVAVPLTMLTIACGITACSGTGDPLTYEDSPLAAYVNVGASTFTAEQWTDRVAQEEKQREDFIAKCMKDEGFEYVPNVPVESPVDDSVSAEWLLNDREWVATYGYGVLDYPGRETDPQLSETEAENPNATYVATLSPSEQEAYQQTLYGNEAEPDADGVYQCDSTQGGCYGQAQNQIVASGGGNPWEADEFVGIREAMDAFDAEFQAGDALAEIDKKWSECMAKSDFDFARRNDANESIFKQLEQIWADLDAESQGDTDPELHNVETNPDPRKLQDEEVRLTLADLDCRVKVNYDDEALKIRFAAEEEFVADHKAELEAFKRALEAA